MSRWRIPAIAAVLMCVLVAGGVLAWWALSRVATHPAPPGNARDAVITMERTMCYGMCPDYTVTIHGDGRVEYEGREYVTTKGVKTAQVDSVKVKALVDDFYDAGFFALRDEYTDQVTDLPTTTTSITVDGRTKKVVNYYGAPEKLERLEGRIDEVAGSRQWVGAGH